MNGFRMVSALAALVACGALAQQYPVKPVKIVVAFTAGGTTDIMARTLAQRLTERFRQPFVIENKPGAGGNLGTEIVCRAPAEAIAALNKATNEIIAEKAIEARMVDEGADPTGGSPEKFGAFVKSEYEKWRAVVKASGAVVD